MYLSVAPPPWLREIAHDLKKPAGRSPGENYRAPNRAWRPATRLRAHSRCHRLRHQEEQARHVVLGSSAALEASGQRQHVPSTSTPTKLGSSRSSCGAKLGRRLVWH
jgi:hypothetical protein